MQLSSYLSFNGQCEAAFTFYAKCLDGELGPVFRYAGSPMAQDVPADWQDKIMHGSVKIGDQVLMGADILSHQYEAPKGFSISIQIKGATHAERIFRALAEGGKIVLPLEKTFWAERFGMVVDRFGIPWQINCEA
jgi:PhnB protein